MLTFHDAYPETIPGTTAIGVSASVLRDLTTNGQSEFTYYSRKTPPPGAVMVADSGPLERYWKNQGVLRRVEPKPVPVSVLVNRRRVHLPAIHARGEFKNNADVELYIVNDPANPLILRRTTEDVKLQVVKLSFPDEQIENDLTQHRRAEVDIYFDSAKAELREESEPVLKEIADVLTKNPGWQLNVEGHTDNIGSDAFNLGLSKRRAAAVKEALIERYHIARDRLTTMGFGASRPKETNTTIEGRARNRRAELVRQWRRQAQVKEVVRR